MTRLVICCRHAVWMSHRVGCEQAILAQPTPHLSRLSLVWKKSYAKGVPHQHPQQPGNDWFTRRRYFRFAAYGIGLSVCWYYRWLVLEPFFPVKHGDEDAAVQSDKSKAGLGLMDSARNVMANLTKTLSRNWGYIVSTEIPKWLRAPLYTLYIKTFNCNMEEVEIKDLTHYRSIQEFFTRRLAPGVRPVDSQHCIVSPSDGKILHLGIVQHDRVEQIKGITYSLHDFLGKGNWPTRWGMPAPDRADEQHRDSVQCNPDTSLYHCVIYLAPGNYHGFHSPADWTATLRRHFPGSHLLSVRPSTVAWIPDIYVLNERVVLLGDWEHGFFSMAAVGAFNVGSIRIFADKELKTNQKNQTKTGKDSLLLHFDNRDFRHKDSEVSRQNSQDQSLTFSKGDSVGEFNMGSTIVLIFEAPRNFEFKISAGQEIKYGQPIGACTGGTSKTYPELKREGLHGWQDDDVKSGVQKH